MQHIIAVYRTSIKKDSAREPNKPGARAEQTVQMATYCNMPPVRLSKYSLSFRTKLPDYFFAIDNIDSTGQSFEWGSAFTQKGSCNGIYTIRSCRQITIRQDMFYCIGIGIIVGLSLYIGLIEFHLIGPLFFFAFQAIPVYPIACPIACWCPTDNKPKMRTVIKVYNLWCNF